MKKDPQGTLIEVMPRRMLISYATAAGIKRSSTTSNEMLLSKLITDGYFSDWKSEDNMKWTEFTKEPPLHYLTEKGKRLFNEFAGYERFVLEPKKEYPVITERSPEPKRDAACDIFLTIEQAFTESLFKEMNKYGVPFEINELTYHNIGKDDMFVEVIVKFKANVYNATSVGSDTKKHIISSSEKTEQEITLTMKKTTTSLEWEITGYTNQSVYSPIYPSTRSCHGDAF